MGQQCETCVPRARGHPGRRRVRDARCPDRTQPPGSRSSRPLTDPFPQVTAGQVKASSPTAGTPSPSVLGRARGLRRLAGTEAWTGHGRLAVGISATWVDATRVGVPSTSTTWRPRPPALASSPTSPDCRAIASTCTSTTAPPSTSDRDSAGDYIARGRGDLPVRGMPTRWAYFVAAPGFGPVREVGIPARASTWSWRSCRTRGRRAPPDVLRAPRFGGARPRLHRGAPPVGLSRSMPLPRASVHERRPHDRRRARRPRMSTSTLSPRSATSPGPEVGQGDAGPEHGRERAARHLADQLSPTNTG